MANAGTLQILVVGDTDPLVSAMKKGERATGSLNTAAGKLGMTLESINAPFERLKKIFGARGPLKDLTELAVGGGAFAGISFLTGTLERATGRAKDLVNEFRAGKKTTGELADETLRLIPIFGSVYAAGRNIREIFTGDEAFLARAREQADQIDRTAEAIKQVGIAAKSAFKDALETARSLREEAQRITIGMSGPGSDAALIRFNIDAETKRAIEGLQKQLTEMVKEPQKRMDDLRDSIGKLQDPERALIFTGGGGIGGTAGVVREGDAEYKARLAEVQAQRNAIQIQINQIQAEIDQAKASTDAGVAEVQAAAAAKLAAQLKELEKSQADLATQANNAATNESFAKWLDKYNTAKDRAKDIIKGLRTPAQQYADTLKELDDLLQRNMLTQQQYNQAVAGAKLEQATSQLDLLQAGMKPIELKFASGQDIGTAATDALAAKIAAAVGGSVADRTEAKQLIELQKQVTELRELNRKIKVGSSN